jgi:hypothetical protein
MVSLEGETEAAQDYTHVLQYQGIFYLFIHNLDDT